MEKCEIACLRAIVLFNPDAPGLSNDVSNNVETLREKVYATLEEHCRIRHEKDPSRFAKLLLRLPALRSIGLKCAEHHFFFKLVTEDRKHLCDQTRILIWTNSLRIVKIFSLKLAFTL